MHGATLTDNVTIRIEPLTRRIRANEIARGMSAILGPRAVGMGVSLVLGVSLARWLGPAAFGRYIFAMSWVGVLASVGALGLDTMLMRDLAAHHANGAWALAVGLLRWSTGVVLACTLSLGVLVALGGPHVAGGLGWPPWAWAITGALIPLSALLSLQQSALRGLHRLAWSQLPAFVAQPAAMLALIGVAVVLGAERIARDDAHAVLLQLLATGAALLLAWTLLAAALPPAAGGVRPEYQRRAWSASASSFLLMSWLNAVNGRVDVLVLGALGGAAELGPYAAARRGAGLIPLALNVSVTAMAPALARLYAVGDAPGVRALFARMSRLSLFIGAPIALALMVGGQQFLRLYGPGFPVARAALAVLSAGELVNVTAGPVATLLVVTGHQRYVAAGVALGTVLNIVLCLLLVPRWGMNGAAVGAAGGVSAWNIVLWIHVHRRLGPVLRGDVRAATSARAMLSDP
ncbi:MAG: polysaccharide biosynthesis protein [Gemmatimonadetes bacterium]|nr:polysaccharide biosynthesis protein [Gemmatimonadota bacterium]